MAIKLKGDDYCPRCGAFLKIANIDLDPPP
jgi:hypothetical protein